MPRRLFEREILEGEVLSPSLPSRRTSSSSSRFLEREQEWFARTRSKLAGIEKNRQLKDIEGSVSNEHLEYFADRLIRESAAKQQKADIVAQHIRRATRLLDEAVRDKPRKGYTTSFVPKRWASDYPRTVFGTDAWAKATGSQLRKKFINRYLALPCVERMVRREVLFAKGKSGKGYRVPHRMSKFADIWC